MAARSACMPQQAPPPLRHNLVPRCRVDPQPCCAYHVRLQPARPPPLWRRCASSTIGVAADPGKRGHRRIAAPWPGSSSIWRRQEPPRSRGVAPRARRGRAGARALASVTVVRPSAVASQPRWASPRPRAGPLAGEAQPCAAAAARAGRGRARGGGCCTRLRAASTTLIVAAARHYFPFTARVRARNPFSASARSDGSPLRTRG